MNLYEEMIESVLDHVEKYGFVTTVGVKRLCHVGNEKARTIINYLIDSGKLVRNNQNRCVFSDEGVGKLSEEVAESFEDHVHETATRRDVVRYKMKASELSRKVRELEKEQIESYEKSNRLAEAIEQHLKHTKWSTLNKSEDVIIPTSSTVELSQVSDTHFNETIDTRTNKFDITIASKRMQKLASWVKKFRHEEIKDGILALTGDIYNSGRRRDELFHNEFDMASAFFKGVDIASQYALDLSAGLENLSVFSVPGNESRFFEKWDTLSWKENWDTMLHRFLAERLHEHSDKIKFGELEPGGKVITVGGGNILLVHGHHGNNFSRYLEKYTQSRRIEDQKIIHWILSGHIHSVHQTQHTRRSGSLPGGNEYSSYELNLASRSTQAIHHIVVEKEGYLPDLQTINVNLDIVDGFEGYPLDTFKFGGAKYE